MDSRWCKSDILKGGLRHPGYLLLLPAIMHISIVLLLLAVFMWVCIKTGKLSPAAALAAGLVGLMTYAGGGYTGILLLGVFFILATLATSHKKELKAAISPAGSHPEKRRAGQVFANGGVTALMGIPVMADPANTYIYIMMMAASLASATADTVSSELGTVYGRNFYNILSFKREPKGLDGVVSLEGTLAGAAGSLVIALAYGIATGPDRKSIYVLLAGILGNFVDSVLGASLERKHYIGNDVVNFLNTLFAALIALLFFYILR